MKNSTIEHITPEISITTGVYGVSILPLKNITSKNEEAFLDKNTMALNHCMNSYDRKRGVLGTINYLRAERMLEDAYSEWEKNSMKIKPKKLYTKRDAQRIVLESLFQSGGTININEAKEIIKSLAYNNGAKVSKFFN